MAIRVRPGVSIPHEAMMHPPVSGSPLFPRIVQMPWENFPIWPFPKNIFRFSSAKIPDDLFESLTQNFEFHLFISQNSTFPPISRKLLFPPAFSNIPPDFGKCTCFLHTLRVFPPSLTMMHLCITRCTYWTPRSSTVEFVDVHASCVYSVDPRVVNLPGSVVPWWDLTNVSATPV